MPNAQSNPIEYENEFVFFFLILTIWGLCNSIKIQFYEVQWL